MATDVTAKSPAIKRTLLSSGVTLEYAEQGSSTGAPVVFLHGITDSWHSFELVLPHLPASLSVFALSQRGHGNSDRPEGEYTIPILAADVAQFMDTVGVASAVIVGHSLGSLVALQFAIEHNNRTKGLVLGSATPSMIGNQPFVELAEALEQMKDPIPYEFAREFQESTLTQAVPPEFLETVVAECRKPPLRVWRAATDGLLHCDLSDDLASIGAPAIVINGNRDTIMSRADHEAVVTAIRDSTLLTYEGAGHSMHWEEPRRFAADLVAFVGRVNAKHSR